MKNKKIVELEQLLSTLADLGKDIEKSSNYLWASEIWSDVMNASHAEIRYINVLRGRFIPKESVDQNNIFSHKGSSVFQQQFEQVTAILHSLVKFLNALLKLKQRTSGGLLLDDIYFNIANRLEMGSYYAVIDSPVFINQLADYLEAQPDLLKIKVLEFCGKDHSLKENFNPAITTPKIEKMFKLIQDVEFDINIDDKEILGLTPWHKLDVISSAAQQILEESGMVNNLQLEGSYGLY